jgi:hypothetical protein
MELKLKALCIYKIKSFKIWIGKRTLSVVNIEGGFHQPTLPVLFKSIQTKWNLIVKLTGLLWAKKYW